MTATLPYEVPTVAYRCLRCDHVWQPRIIGEKPRRCGGCGDPNWDRPRKWNGNPPGQAGRKTLRPAARKAKAPQKKG